MHTETDNRHILYADMYIFISTETRIETASVTISHTALANPHLVPVSLHFPSEELESSR